MNNTTTNPSDNEMIGRTVYSNREMILNSVFC